MKMSDVKIKDMTLGMQVWYIGGLFNSPTLFSRYIKEIKGIGFYLVYNEMGMEVIKHYSELFTDLKTAAEKCIAKTEKVISAAQSYINKLKEQITNSASAA